eukprot:1150220-Pelagomonas_calceolata.AAC.6
MQSGSKTAPNSTRPWTLPALAWLAMLLCGYQLLRGWQCSYVATYSYVTGNAGHSLAEPHLEH